MISKKINHRHCYVVKMILGTLNTYVQLNLLFAF